MLFFLYDDMSAWRTSGRLRRKKCEFRRRGTGGTNVFLILRIWVLLDGTRSV